MIDTALFIALASLIILAAFYFSGGRITRRQYSDTLRDLPIGVFSLRSNGRVQMWNRSMEEITGVASERAIRCDLSGLPTPWNGILGEFARSPKDADPRIHLPDEAGPGRWIGLHKAAVESSGR